MRLLGPFLALLAVLRLGRTLFWLFLRPGGWALLVGAAVLYLSLAKG